MVCLKKTDKFFKLLNDLKNYKFEILKLESIRIIGKLTIKE